MRADAVPRRLRREDTGDVKVVAIPPHGIQDAREATGHGDNCNRLAAAALDPARPRAQGRRPRVGRATHAPRGLDEQGLYGGLRAAQQPSALLVLPELYSPGASPR